MRPAVAPSAPAVRGASGRRPAELRGGAGAAAPAGAGAESRGRPWRLGAGSGARRPGRAARWGAPPGTGLGCWGVGAAPRGGGAGPVRCGPGMGGPPNREDAADEDERDQEALGKQHVRCHDNVPFPAGERRLFSWRDSRWHYPLPGGTAPTLSASRVRAV